MDAASMKGLKQQQWIAAKMVNAQCPVMMVKIAAKKKVPQWIVVKMANVPKKDILVLIAARNHNNNF